MHIQVLCPHEDHKDNAEADPRYVEWRPCVNHKSEEKGLDDAVVLSLTTGELAFSGTGEAGSDGAAWAKVLNRNSPYRRRRRWKMS